MGINYGDFMKSIKKGVSSVVDNNTPVGVLKAWKGYKKDKAGQKKSEEDLKKIQERAKKRKKGPNVTVSDFTVPLPKKTRPANKPKKKKIGNYGGAQGKAGFKYSKWD